MIGFKLILICFEIFKYIDTYESIQNICNWCIYDVIFCFRMFCVSVIFDRIQIANYKQKRRNIANIN